MRHSDPLKTKHRQHMLSFARQKGAVAVEMACLSVVMFLLFAGLFEFSRVFWYYNALDKSTRDAARFISALPTATITSNTAMGTALSTATNIALITANGASVKPALTSSNIEIKCDSASCTGSKPENVTVRIVNFSVKLGGIVPFIGVKGGDYGNATLSPSTTMRYMN